MTMYTRHIRQSEFSDFSVLNCIFELPSLLISNVGNLDIGTRVEDYSLF